MKTYTLVLTEVEKACGVTLEQVAELLPKVLVRQGKVIFPTYVGPALAGATARCALAHPAEYVGLNSLGHPVYVAEVR